MILESPHHCHVSIFNICKIYRKLRCSTVNINTRTYKKILMNKCKTNSVLISLMSLPD